MMKIKVTLKFDDKNLGKKWMNIDNFKLLLYSKFSTLERLGRSGKKIENRQYAKLFHQWLNNWDDYVRFVGVFPEIHIGL